VPARRLIAVAIALAVALSACGTDRTPDPAAPPTTPSVATSGLSAEFNAADVRFVQALIPHHEQGIALAELGAAKAADPQLRMLANAIVTTQRDEVTRMRGWLKAWRQPPAGSAEPAPLPKATGKALDRELLTRLIAHQQEAVELAAPETADGRNLNTVSFAEQIQKSRAAEIKQMRDYLQGL